MRSVSMETIAATKGDPKKGLSRGNWGSGREQNGEILKNEVICDIFLRPWMQSCLKLVIFLLSELSHFIII